MATCAAYLWRGRCGAGLTTREAFHRQHRLHHIPLEAPGVGRPLPGGAAFTEEFHRGGPWGGPPGGEGVPLDTHSFSERAMKQFLWQEEGGGFVKRPEEEPGVGSASGASGSPLAAVAAAAGAAAAAAAAVRRAAAASPLGPLLLKTQLAAKSAIDALTKPTEDIHIATLSELFANTQLERMRQFMMDDEEGREVLRHKPLLDDRFVNYEALRRLPKDTLGYALVRFLDSNALHAGHRQPVRFVENEELAYVLTRYRQLHDVMHAAFGMGISVESEVALKLIEFHQTGLPMTLLAAAFGPFAAPLLRVHLAAAAASSAHAGPAPAAVAAAAHGLTASPNNLLHVLLPQQQPAAAATTTGAASDAPVASAGAATSAAAAEPASATAAAACDDPVVLYPRRMLLNEMLPWADAAGKVMRRRVYCLFVEKWFDKPLKAFQTHCGITPAPSRFAAYCA